MGSWLTALPGFTPILWTFRLVKVIDSLTSNHGLSSSPLLGVEVINGDWYLLARFKHFSCFTNTYFSQYLGWWTIRFLRGVDQQADWMRNHPSEKSEQVEGPHWFPPQWAFPMRGSLKDHQVPGFPLRLQSVDQEARPWISCYRAMCQPLAQPFPA